MPSQVFDARGKVVPLGEELGRGGEGAVYALAGKNDGAAKLYLKPPGRSKAEKIIAMAGMASPRLTALSAWPTATLHAADGTLVGFVMPKLAGHRPVFQVYGLKLRLRQFPKADWRFLVHTAGNVARAFGVMHAAGLVVGDVNHGNLFVGQDATVRFVDTDSFQVTRGERRWPCEVGVGTHQPPEMQGLTSYLNVVRTPNHDNFGLAVLIFQLLCIGRHPFSGRYTGVGEPPDIERAITESRYAYADDTQRTQMAAAPGSLPMAALPEGVQALFEQAFAPIAVRGGRPSPEQWTAELASLGSSLRRCNVNAAHWYAPRAAGCPWCDVESRSGTMLFPAVFIAGAAGVSGIALLWQEIEAVDKPGRLGPLIRPSGSDAQASPRIQAVGRRLRRRKQVAALSFVVCLIAIFSILPNDARLISTITAFAATSAFGFLARPPQVGEARLYAHDLKRMWTKLEAEWAEMQSPALFDSTQQKLAALKQEYDGLTAERTRQLKGLATHRREHQLVAHLEGFELSNAKISGIGKAKIATLLSYGIETVVDFEATRLSAVPGFGPKTIAAMLAYRAACEGSFVFDAGQTVATTEITKLDARFTQQRLRIETELRNGLAQLRVISAAELERLRILEARANELRPMLARALANARAMGLPSQ